GDPEKKRTKRNDWGRLSVRGRLQKGCRGVGRGRAGTKRSRSQRKGAVMRRYLLFVAAPAGLILALSPLAARADLAPPGDATATALRVGQLVGISDTAAHAASDGANGQATVLGIGGQPALGLGGAQHDEGESHGGLVQTGATGVGDVQIAPWETSVKSTGGTGRTAKGRAG